MSIDWHVVIHEILIPLVIGLGVSILAILFGISRLEKRLESHITRQRLGKLRDFWQSEGSSRRFNIVLGKEWIGKAGELEPRMTFAQSYGVSQITSILDIIYRDSVQVELCAILQDARLPPDLFNDHVVIFGSEYTVGAFGDVCQPLGMPFYQHQWDINHRKFTRMEHGLVIEELPSLVIAGQIKHDVGTIVRVINPKNRNLIVLYNANYGVGLLGAILMTTVPTNFQRSHGFDEAAAAQQLVVQVDNITDNMITKAHPVGVARSWQSFSVDTEKVDAGVLAATTACSGHTATSPEGKASPL